MPTTESLSVMQRLDNHERTLRDHDEAIQHIKEGHGVRLTSAETHIDEIRAENRFLLERLNQLHGENKANAEARERNTLNAIKACQDEVMQCRQEVRESNSVRTWVRFALITTGVAFAYAMAHFAGWMT